MWIELAAGAYLLGDFIYHRLTYKADMPKRARGDQIRIPRTEPGSPIGSIYGRVRVREPILAWGRALQLVEPSNARADLFYVLGSAMNAGRATTRVRDLWIGDTRFSQVYGDLGGPVDANGKFLQTGNGGPEELITGFAGLGYVETLNGNPNQVLAHDASTTLNAPTYAGRRMLEIMPATEIAGYRGYASVFLHGFAGWPVSQQSEPAHSFEVESIEDGNGYPASGIYARAGGVDCNPMNAAYDILVSKLGLPASMIDMTSWGDAAITLYQEGHGWSRFVDESQPAEDVIAEILEQIDATIDQDPSDGLIKVKLIRPDYDYNALREINSRNCVQITGFALGGHSTAPNRMRLIYTDRANDYRDGSVTAAVMANAVGQDGRIREVVLHYPGVCTRELAEQIIGREMAARSRPQLKCSAFVDRSFEDVMRGEALILNWRNPDVSSVVMRVADVDRGTLYDGKIRLDLISDHHYSFRRLPPSPQTVIPFPRPGGLTQGL